MLLTGLVVPVEDREPPCGNDAGTEGPGNMASLQGATIPELSARGLGRGVETGFPREGDSLEDDVSEGEESAAGATM